MQIVREGFRLRKIFMVVFVVSFLGWIGFVGTIYAIAQDYGIMCWAILHYPLSFVADGWNNDLVYDLVVMGVTVIYATLAGIILSSVIVGVLSLRRRCVDAMDRRSTIRGMAKKGKKKRRR